MELLKSDPIHQPVRCGKAAKARSKDPGPTAPFKAKHIEHPAPGLSDFSGPACWRIYGNRDYACSRCKNVQEGAAMTFLTSALPLCPDCVKIVLRDHSEFFWPVKYFVRKTK